MTLPRDEEYGAMREPMPIDDATLAAWEHEVVACPPFFAAIIKTAITEIRRLREEVANHSKCIEEIQVGQLAEAERENELHAQKDATLAAHRAVVRELAQLLENACAMRQSGGFLGDNIDRWLTSIILLLAHPLVQQAREEK